MKNFFLCVLLVTHLIRCAEPNATTQTISFKRIASLQDLEPYHNKIVAYCIPSLKLFLENNSFMFRQGNAYYAFINKPSFFDDTPKHLPTLMPIIDRTKLLTRKGKIPVLKLSEKLLNEHPPSLRLLTLQELTMLHQLLLDKPLYAGLVTAQSIYYTGNLLPQERKNYLLSNLVSIYELKRYVALLNNRRIEQKQTCIPQEIIELICSYIIETLEFDNIALNSKLFRSTAILEKTL